MLAMMVAIGVVISPILRFEGMCPTAVSYTHLDVYKRQLLSSICTWFVTRRALTPLRRFSDRIRQVQAQNLSE